MSTTEPPNPPSDPTAAPTPPPAPGYAAAPPPAPGYAGAPPPGYAPPAPAPTAYTGAIGQVRGTGISMLLFFVTLGIYGWVWYYKTHEEMKQHTGQGIGGLVAFLLAFFIGVASPFLSSSEVGNLYKRAGRPEPVSAVTGLWYLPGIFLIVLPIVWFVKTNGALNDYWKSLGATG